MMHGQKNIKLQRLRPA